MFPRPFPAHIHCVAPVFNEECAVARFVNETALVLDAIGRPWEIVLLDDGSTDGTRTEAQKLGRTMPVRIISFPHRGIGAIMREFVTLAGTWPDDDAAIFTEGDGTCDPAFIRPALQALAGDRMAGDPDETGSTISADVCTASRYLDESEVSGFPARRRLQSYVSNRMLSARYGQGQVTDFTLFARAYRVSALKQVPPGNLRRDGFEANAELLVALLETGARAAEVPVNYRYGLKSGRSKLPTLQTILGYGRLFRER